MKQKADHTKVLEFMANEVKGGILTSTSLKAFIAVEKAADCLDMDWTSRESAQLAVLLPEVPLERIRKEFGSKTADIVEDLRGTNQYSKIAINAEAMHAKSEGDKVREDTAIAAMAAAAAFATPESFDSIVSWLEDKVDQETYYELSASLKNLSVQFSERSPMNADGSSQGRFSVISVSMDVCGSTELKKCMKDCAQDDEELLDKWYGEFYRQFLLREWQFYSMLFQEGGDGLAWDWKHTFYVKGIGDEIWLLYEVSEDDRWKLESLFVRLLRAALDVAYRLIMWTSAPEGAEPSKDKSWETRNLPLKFYVDILDDAFGVSEPRREFMTEHASDFLRLEENRNSEDFIKFCNRFHAGYFMGDGRRLITAIRSDYIGWEVDRFFRATKFALPGVVTVGQNLFKATCHRTSNSDEEVGCSGLMKTTLEYISQRGGIHYLDCFRYVKKEISAKNLKGVGEKYTVYRMLHAHDLLILRHISADKEIMKKTFNVFTRKMEKAERAR